MKQIDLSRVDTARDIHVLLSKALDFPDWYRHDWETFSELILSECPLPAELVFEGIEHVEQRLPADVEQLRKCLADYNKQSGSTCRVVYR